jgi:hypothetical protein
MSIHQIFNIHEFRKAIQLGNIFWRKHVLQKTAERGIRQNDILEVLLNGECIQEYKDDKPYPSALFYNCISNKPLHVVASFDHAQNIAYIITAYEPSLNIFNADYKTRKKND